MRKNIFPITDPLKRLESKLLFSKAIDIQMLNAVTQNHYSVNSQKSMVSDWNNFVSFCYEKKVSPLPASVTAVRLFLEAEAKSKKFSSIRRVCLTIGTIHHIHTFQNPTNHRQIKIVLSELSIKMKGDSKTAIPFTCEHLNKLSALLSSSTHAKDLRDLAIFCVMFECALKRSELRALQKCNVSFLQGNAKVQVEENVYELSESSSSTLKKWIVLNHTNTLFCRIDKHENFYDHTLDDSSIYRLFRHASSLLNLPDSGQFSVHSIRVGAAKQLAIQGFRLDEIQDFGRWFSPVMPAQYLGRLSRANKEKMKFISIKPWD